MWPNLTNGMPLPGGAPPVPIYYPNLRPALLTPLPPPKADGGGGSSSTSDRASRGGACVACREAHTACDMSRPCARCKRLGKPHLCMDAPNRKRGRPIASRERASFADPESEMASISTDNWGTVTIKADDNKNSYGEASAQPRPQDDTQVEKMEIKRLKTRFVAGTNFKLGKLKRLQALEDKVDVLSRLVERLSSEVEILRRSNSDLTHELTQLRGQLRHQDISKAEPDAIDLRSGDHSSSPSTGDRCSPAYSQTPTMPQLSHAQSPPSEIATQHAGVSPALVLEARNQLPWFCYYDIPPRFAIRSFSLPICVLEERFTWEVPTVVVYANAAFAELTQYSLEELMGTSYTKLFALPPNVHLYTPVLYNQRPMAASELISFGLTLRRKDGVLLRLNDQSQLFYNALGQAKFVLMCVHGWHMDRLCPGECLDCWIPLRNPLEPKTADQPQSQPSRPATISSLDSSSPPNSYMGQPPLHHTTGTDRTSQASLDTLELLDQLSDWPNTPASNLALGSMSASQLPSVPASTLAPPSAFGWGGSSATLPAHSSAPSNQKHYSYEQSFM